MAQRAINLDPDVEQRVQQLETDGKTAMLLAVDGRLARVIAVADTVKDHASEAVADLHREGIEVVMLTGDNERVVRRRVLARRAVLAGVPGPTAADRCVLASGEAGAAENDLKTLARLAKLRWRIEHDFREFKQGSAWITSKAAATAAGITTSPASQSPTRS